MVMRKNYTSQEKAKIALEALKGTLTQSEITSKYGVHSTQILSWKKQLQEGIENIFSDRRHRESQDHSEEIDGLQRKIGQLTMELDWLKKKAELFSSK